MRKISISILALLIMAVMTTILLTVPAFAKPTLNKKSATIKVGQTLVLKVDGAGKKKIKWSSSNSSVATVSKNKSNKTTVLGVKAGTAIIRATVGKNTLICKVIVKKKAPKEVGSSNTGSSNTEPANTGSPNTGTSNSGSSNTGSSDNGSTNSGSSNTGSSNSDASGTSENDTDISITTPLLPQTYLGLRVDRIDISTSLNEDSHSNPKDYYVTVTAYATVLSENANHLDISFYRLSDDAFMGSSGDGAKDAANEGDTVIITFKRRSLPPGRYRLEFGDGMAY